MEMVWSGATEQGVDLFAVLPLYTDGRVIDLVLPARGERDIAAVFFGIVAILAAGNFALGFRSEISVVFEMCKQQRVPGQPDIAGVMKAGGKLHPGFVA